MKVLLMELGLLLQLFQKSFVTYGKWVMNTWLKSIWEKVDKFNITLLCYQSSHQGREIIGLCKQ
jgi:hypothetical protein